MRVPLGARLAGAVACFMILGAGSCATSQPFSGSGLPKLQFVGDSITFQSTADINAHYGASYDVAINGLTGTDTYLDAGIVSETAAADPAIEIIELGTNDANHITAPAPYEPQQTLAQVTGRFDTFASELSPTTCVIFVTVNTHNPSWSPANAQAINDHLRNTPELFAHIADWDAAWDASYFDEPDTPHPNEAGRQALLAVEDQAIAGCSSSS